MLILNLIIKHRFLVLAAIIAGAVGGAGMGVIGSLILLPNDLADRVQSRLAAMSSPAEVRSDIHSISWDSFETTNLTLASAIIPLGSIDGSATGGAIAPIGDNVLYVSANGHIGFLNFETGQISYQSLRVDGDLVIGSLAGMSLYRLRLDGDRVAYVEQIDVGKRLRDIAQLKNGKIIVLTDQAEMVLIADPNSHDISQGSIPDITGYSRVSELEAMGDKFKAEFPWGRQLFSGNCATCHGLDDQPRPGPSLAGVIGARPGARGDYQYSDALRNMKGRWTRERLHRFIEDPQSVAPGTNMPGIDSLDKWESRAIVEYLYEAASD